MTFQKNLNKGDYHLMLKGKVHKYGARGLKGAKPLLKNTLPSPLAKGRGIKGEGFPDAKR